MEYSLRTYYAKYLIDVRGLSDRTVRHYEESLRWISVHLKSKGLISDCIYEVSSASRIHELREILKNDPVFIDLDKRGHQMYSAGLNNYIRFVEGTAFVEHKYSPEKIDMPIVAPTPNMVHGKVIWPISPIIKNQSLAMADYTCEINPNHRTFCDKKTSLPFMEGHHLISMNKQLRFMHSLDVFANIICVCPNCHRMLHFAIDTERKPYLEQLFVSRSERLAHSGIYLSKDEFLEKAMA